ncbi:MAG TPA: 23S rRNA (uracil(1939)-C(5))-methyltransferase RlmD [Terriglobales bacterium]|nr:23S rRNA (uracil(1939)-C(5))-methyltransferase RlmD [Terriglobales bacterium]
MELTIDKMMYGGDGLARFSAREGKPGKAVFVPYTLPGERVRAEITQERPGFARAQLEEVLEPSALRTEPPCPYFGRCGGCQYQHTGYDNQLRIKSDTLSESLRRTGKIELACEIQTHSSPPLGYRNRTRFHVCAHPEFAIGYFHSNSHRLLPVNECPISSPRVNAILAELWRAGSEKKIPPEVREIEAFADAADEKVLIEIYADERANQKQFEFFAGEFAERTPAVAGVAIFRGASSQRKPLFIHGASSLDYEVGNEKYRVSAGAFFQTNRFLVPKMVELVTRDRSGKVAFDLYAGVGLFMLPLARHFEQVFAVESSEASASDLRANAPKNVTVNRQSVEDFLRRAGRNLSADFVVVDPPRAGLGEAVTAQLASSTAQEIVYVSCDPATLARDLKQFVAAEWKIAEMHLLDVFPQTFHIESIAVLRR